MRPSLPEGLGENRLGGERPTDAYGGEKGLNLPHFLVLLCATETVAMGIGTAATRPGREGELGVGATATAVVTPPLLLLLV